MVKQVTIVFALNLATLPQDFSTRFASDMSTALGVPASRIRVLSLASGSVVVVFQILPSTTPTDPSPDSLVTSLNTLFTSASTNTSSPFRSGVLGSLDFTQPPKSADAQLQYCADGSLQMVGKCPSTPTPTPSSTDVTGMAIGIAVGATVFLLLLALIWWYCLKKKQPKYDDSKTIELKPPIQVHPTAHDNHNHAVVSHNQMEMQPIVVQQPQPQPQPQAVVVQGHMMPVQGHMMPVQGQMVAVPGQPGMVMLAPQQPVMMQTVVYVPVSQHEPVPQPVGHQIAPVLQPLSSA
eukprot:TRINITY_DN6613_c0_g1_i2.p1 TRINITY_DN6613_c0_g1~~TRINITY_DN6613_c0_g1_i2.p1  ORF type:complete len:293 (-),score=91.16 TRINITY_DN6613_c0_g1_i2:138-1016(-)